MHLDYQATLGTVARLAVPTIADWCAVDISVDGRLRTLAVAHVDPAKVALGQRLRSGIQQIRTPQPNPRHTGRGVIGPAATTAHRLLVLLTLGPVLAGFGLGVRSVALTSAAHAGRVALIWPARTGRRST
jgi:hypothetical protein